MGLVGHREPMGVGGGSPGWDSLAHSKAPGSLRCLGDYSSNVSLGFIEIVNIFFLFSKANLFTGKVFPLTSSVNTKEN